MAPRRLLRGYQHFIVEYNLKMEADFPSETVTLVYQTIQCHSPEDCDMNHYNRHSPIFHRHQYIPAIYLKNKPNIKFLFARISRTSKIPLAFEFSLQYFVCILHVSYSCYMITTHQTFRTNKMNNSTGCMAFQESRRSTWTVSSRCTCPVWACQRAMDQLPCLETSTTS